MKKSLTLILIVLVTISCTESKLDIALNLAGDNRLELERVLDHYSSQNDSLKFKAATFLIENMPGHYSYAGDDINHYYDEIDSILRNDSIDIDIYEAQLADISKKYPNLGGNKVMDINIITSDFLIYSIDKAFNDWQQPMAQHLTFDEFCEALLPYKTTELQSLDYWRDSLKMRYNPEILYPEIIEYSNTPYLRYNQIMKDMKTRLKFKISSQGDKFYRPLSSSNIHLIRSGACHNYIDLISSVMRANGIPVYKESYPQWGKSHNTGHSFLAVVNKNGINLPYNDVGSWNPAGYLRQERNIPKVYRQTYAINNKRLEYYRKTKFKSPHISLFVKDITSDYYSTSTINIELNNKRIKDNYVYLSFFSNGDWNVLDCAKQKGKVATFEQVGRNNMYIIQGFDGDKLVAISDPFILKMNGDIECVDYNKGQLESVSLSRKYYKSTRLVDFENRARGVIEASNVSDFSKRDTICAIDYPGRFTILDSMSRYRYWRFIPYNTDICNIAELQFFKGDSVIYGEVITNITNINGNYRLDNAFDGNWLTNVESKDITNPWIGLDFGTPLSIDKILCVPRSDDNNIHIGDDYKLSFWNGNKWEQIGTKRAEDNPIVFDSIPSNAVLLLDNATRGSQTRIFTYENEKQIWW